MHKIKTVFIYCFLLIMCFCFSGCGKIDIDLDAYFEYLNTLERQDNVCVYGSSFTDYLYFTDGAVSTDAMNSYIGINDFYVITASEEYIFFDTFSKPSKVYKAKRDLSEWEKIATIPSCSDYSLDGCTLYYTEEDGKHYIRDLLNDEVTYVGEDDCYCNAHFEEEKYTADVNMTFFEKYYYRVRNKETGKYVDISLDRFYALEEIDGSILDGDLRIYAYAHYEGDVYFFLVSGCYDNPWTAYYGAALIFKYEPETDILSYYSWIDTSVNGGFSGPTLVVF